jgi:3-phenylpropionate/cinnamic acid dioxygenase small subunit
MTTERTTALTGVSREEIENFLYREARLIDENKLNEWLALFTEDCRYWIPANHDTVDTSREVSFIWDNYQHLSDRVWRLQSGLAHTTDPASRLRRIVSNVEIGSIEGDEVEVHCNMVIFRLRRAIQDTIPAHCVFRLRRVDGDWRIVSKKVELLNNFEPTRSLQFIL